jgi:hypothetical protein
MKTLRELAERVETARRRAEKMLTHLPGTPRADFAFSQFEKATRVFVAALMDGSYPRHRRVIVESRGERERALDEVCVKLTALRDDAETKDYDSYYEGYIDGLNTALDEIEALQKKDKKHG